MATLQPNTNKIDSFSQYYHDSSRNGNYGENYYNYLESLKHSLMLPLEVLAREIFIKQGRKKDAIKRILKKSKRSYRRLARKCARVLRIGKNRNDREAIFRAIASRYEACGDIAVKGAKTFSGGTSGKEPIANNEASVEESTRTERHQDETQAIFLTPYSDLRAKHETELKASAIHPDLWENWITLDDSTAIANFLLVGDIPRTNTGRVTSEFLHKYDGLDSGWVVETLGSDFCQVKPDSPRTYHEPDGKRKIIKYESPLRYPTDIFRFRYLPHWIADGKTMEEYYQELNASVGEVYICEGIKKLGALVSLGLPAVGLAGMNNINVCKGGEPIPALVEAIRYKKVVNLVLDSPERLNQMAGLELAYKKIKELVLRVNTQCQVNIVCLPWWMGKGVDDAIASGNASKELIESSCVPYDEAFRFINENIPAHKRIVGKRYLDLADVDYFKNRKYYGIKANRGCGKTELVSQYLAIIQAAIPILGVTHSIKLGMELAKRHGCRYHNDPQSRIPGTENKLLICINSLNLRNINPEDYKGCVAVLDEVVQLFHFLYSGTLKESKELIHNLVTILKNASLVICSDADLDFKSLDLLDSLLPGENLLNEIEIIEMQPEVVKMPMSVFKVNNKKVGAAVYQKALSLLIEGHKPLIMVDSQNPKSKLGAETLKRNLEKDYFEMTGKEVKGLALFAKATKNKGKEASRIITDEKGVNVVFEYDFVVYTTVVGTGVSWDADKDKEVPYFDYVLGGFSGSIDVNSMLQGLHRYRKLVPRIVYLPNKGLSTKNYNDSYSWRQNRLNTSKLKGDILQLHAAIAFDIPGCDEGINRPIEKHHAKLRAIHKYECDHFFDQFVKQASKDYDLVVDGTPMKIDIPASLEETAKEVFTEYCEEIVEATAIKSEQVYEEMKTKSVLLEKDAKDFEKTSAFSKKYHIEHAEKLITRELVELDSMRGFNSGILNHYYLDKLYYAEASSEKNIKRDLLDFEKYHKDSALKAKLFLELGANLLIDSLGEIIHKEHDIVKKIVKNYLQIEKEKPGLIARHLNLRLNTNEPMKMISSIADKLALNGKSLGKKKLFSGERVAQTIYSLEGENLRFDLFKIWDENNEYSVTQTVLEENKNQQAILESKLQSQGVPESDKIEIRKQLPPLYQEQRELENYRQEITRTREERNYEFMVSRNPEVKVNKDADDVLLAKAIADKSEGNTKEIYQISAIEYVSNPDSFS